MSKSLQFVDKNVKMHNYLRDMHFLFEAEARRVNNELGRCPVDSYTLNGKEIKYGGYPCIHLGAEEFCNTLNEVLKKFPKNTDFSQLKFIDVGSGVGEK